VHAANGPTKSPEITITQRKAPHMVDEALFAQRINSDLVPVQRCLVPARTVLTGVTSGSNRSTRCATPQHSIRLGMVPRQRGKLGLPALGPFSGEQAMASQMQDFAAALDRAFYAFCDPVTGQAVGIATCLPSSRKPASSRSAPSGSRRMSPAPVARPNHCF
jgi:hypothetical protein